ncbi:DUF6622 family protein [Variovorax sp.]|uniref:DUF6622 family protein n=1 Tax=Variovorax sp. TaxID=1871043 RepID=UPI002D2E45B4|nr:DUF6622 family protein [Variovorax sp.]HYP83985.1 DUF6622 family protein [Variovorax sp.]
MGAASLPQNLAQEPSMLIQILSHTPTWVFGLFALLLWLGGRQLRAGQASLGRVAVMPVAMTGLSVYGLFSSFGHSPLALLAWPLAAAAAAALVLRRPLPAGVRFERAARVFHMPGSAVPLVLMMSIFFTKYVVGVLSVMHPALVHQDIPALTVGLLYGAFSGIFLGRAVRLWRLALGAQGGNAPAPALAAD